MNSFRQTFVVAGLLLASACCAYANVEIKVDKTPAGAFSHKGPCPPPSQQHSYEWTVQALDANGRALAAATAVQKFPPR